MTDRTLTYRPGRWLGIVGEHATVLLPESEKGRAGALWALIDDGAGFDTVLDALVAGGLSALPGFVLLAGGGPAVRVLVRGEATATFETDSGQVVVRAEPGAMWAERTVIADEFSIALPGEAVDGPLLAVSEGLVRLGSLETPASAPVLASVVQLTPAPAPVAAVTPIVPAAPAAPAVPLAPVVPVPPLVPASAPDFLAGPLADADEADGTEEPASEVDDLEGLDDLAAIEGEELQPADVLDAPEPVDPVDEDDLATDIFAAYDAGLDAAPLDEVDGLDQDDRDDDGEDADDVDDSAAEADDDAPTDEQAAIDASAVPLGAPPAWIPEAPAAPVGLPVPPAPPLGLVPDLADSQLTEALIPPSAPPVAPVAAQPPAQPTVPPAHLTFSHGAEIDVAGLIVIGRNPDAGRFPEDDQPFVVTVPSPHSEISSTHVEVRPGTGENAGKALVTDLGSTNGTLIVQPGQRPEELRAGVPAVLLSGALIDLGDGLTIRVR